MSNVINFQRTKALKKGLEPGDELLAIKENLHDLNESTERLNDLLEKFKQQISHFNEKLEVLDDVTSKRS